jgi:hypothetical protein
MIEVRACGVKTLTATRILAVSLAAYIVCDILLTPPAGLETRPVAKVTTAGFIVLGLLFVGLALAVVGLVFLFRSSRRAPLIAIVAALLFYPAAIAEQTGNFSAIKPSAAIETVELVQVVVAAIVIGLGVRILREGSRSRQPR